MKKLPFLFEDIIMDEKCEPSVSQGIKVEDNCSVFPEQFIKIYEATLGLGWKELKKWFVSHRDTFQDTIVVDGSHPDDISAAGVENPSLIVLLPRLNSILHLNTYLEAANRKLADNGCLLLHAQTSGARKARIYRCLPLGLNHVVYYFDYIWSRVFAKLHATRWFYYGLTAGRNRNLPRVEILGRLCRAGFTIAGEKLIDGEYIVAAIKASDPLNGAKPSCGPVIRLQRVGYQGKLISVYKFRTMYSYSEFLQKYTYERLGLAKGGKINADFRINVWGRLFRSVWLDEIPMIYNWIKADLKLVGVRPLSRQYFSLYSPAMQELRIRVKPGLIPPFYYEKVSPVTIEDVQESEKRYIEAYLKAPFKTDCRYFWGIVYNIVFRGHRSK